MTKTSSSANLMEQPEISQKELANCIRFLSVDAVEKAKSGHPGMPMGMADVATVLFKNFLKFDPNQPHWPNRDRFILSAGHGSMLLYSLLYLTGYSDISLDEIKNFRQLHSRTAGHPEFGEAGGIETTTGPLGQGLANAVGMSIAESILEQRFGQKLVDHFTYVIAGDGCLMEGISHESISLAGHLGLKKLIVLFDDNEISIDGPTNLTVSDNQKKRFEASGWDVQEIDGHNPEEIYDAIAKAQKTNTPSMIACKTTIGYGSPNKSGKAAAHGAPLGEEEIQITRDELNWPYPAFHIPEAILAEWRKIGARGKASYENWQKSFNQLSDDEREVFENAHNCKLPKNWHNIVLDIKKNLTKNLEKAATRKSSEIVLEALTPHIHEMIGGSADLTGSNNTKPKSFGIISKSNFAERYLHYGVREHAMGAIMNGLALHGGIIPYGGTFLTFADYCRPAIRLSALMKQRVIYVMTHDSIGLGEDGPTHQPIEHLASLRAIPNLNVFRPADTIETLECWTLAIENEKTPSLIALTRQGLPQIRQKFVEENLSSKGAYIIEQAKGKRAVTLFASGSEVSIALEARQKLQNKGIGVTVVSTPCWELFEQQSVEYRNDVLGQGTIRVAIEAGSPFGWERFVGLDGGVVGIESFGASAPANDLFQHFKVNADQVCEEIEKRI